MSEENKDDKKFEIQNRIDALFLQGKGQKMIQHCKDFYFTSKLQRVKFEILCDF